MLPYVATTFLSAFLLFLVQPLIAKFILPWFGGSAAVWSASLMFFQIALLGGYCYAHLLSKAPARMQALVHGVLLLASCALLPILPSEGWKPDAGADPTFRILLLLAATVGLPYFLLSSTGPLLQLWYARRRGSGMPYRLFALSNFGSLLGLISYPFLIEPAVASGTQATAWSLGYAVFTLCCAYTGWVSQCSGAELSDPLGQAEARQAAARQAETKSRLSQSLLWIALAACPSALLLAVTHHLSVNVAPIPLLWVAPLVVYLLTFILAFESDRLYLRELFAVVALPVLALLGWVFYAYRGNLHLSYAFPLSFGGLFLACMLCHGELARRRPSPRYLTSFYLAVALGGALGGVFVALLAPRIFATYLEGPIALIATGIVAVIAFAGMRIPRLPAQTVPALLAVGVTLLAGSLIYAEVTDRAQYRVLSRNFYGALKILDIDTATPRATRLMLNGTIAHGAQHLAEDREEPLAYYGRQSGIGRTIAKLQSAGPLRYGVVGLGAGVLASYARLEDTLQVYEIDPGVIELATTEFDFYGESPASKTILPGDARLTLERQTPQDFDLLVVDAFSSDSIPVHLLTNQAIDLYFQHLKPGGVLAVHLSNRYLDLVPVMRRAAEYVSRSAAVIEDDGDPARSIYPTTWVLISSDSAFQNSLEFVGADIQQAVADDGFSGWTDQFSSLWPMIHID